MARLFILLRWRDELIGRAEVLKEHGQFRSPCEIGKSGELPPEGRIKMLWPYKTDTIISGLVTPACEEPFW